MNQVAKYLRPTVDKGVVKYSSPIPQDIRRFAIPAVPVPLKPVVRQAQQTIQDQENIKQTVQPKSVVRPRRGCSGCRRRLNNI